MEKELTRETVDPRYTWDLTRIYPTDEAWEEAFKEISAGKLFWMRSRRWRVWTKSSPVFMPTR